MAATTLTSLLKDLKEAAGPQFPACLFAGAATPRQASFRLAAGKGKALLTHKNKIYDETERKFYDSLEEWVSAAAEFPAGDSSAAAKLEFGGGAIWLPAAELQLRASLLLQEFLQRIPTLSELLLHVDYLRTLEDTTLWEGKRWEETLFVFDTDNRAPAAAGHFHLRFAPRVRCTFTNGKFVDTKTRRTFKTLEGWLAICGEDADLEDVRFARKELAVGLSMGEVYHRLQALLTLRKQSYKLYEKCVWRYQYICQGTWDEEEWNYWDDEEDADTVWSEEGDEEGDEEDDSEEEEDSEDDEEDD